MKYKVVGTQTLKAETNMYPGFQRRTFYMKTGGGENIINKFKMS